MALTKKDPSAIVKPTIQYMKKGNSKNAAAIAGIEGSRGDVGIVLGISSNRVSPVLKMYMAKLNWVLPSAEPKECFCKEEDAMMQEQREEKLL